MIFLKILGLNYCLWFLTIIGVFLMSKMAYPKISRWKAVEWRTQLKACRKIQFIKYLGGQG